MAKDDDGMKARTYEDVGWDWERDLESQGHGECWRASHLEGGVEALGPPRGDWPACRRSDVSIYEDVGDLLLEHPLVDASNIEVEVIAGIVVLRGQVCTRQEVVACRELVESIVGVAGHEILLHLRPANAALAYEIGADVPADLWVLCGGHDEAP